MPQITLRDATHPSEKSDFYIGNTMKNSDFFVERCVASSDHLHFLSSGFLGPIFSKGILWNPAIRLYTSESSFS